MVALERNRGGVSMSQTDGLRDTIAQITGLARLWMILCLA